MPTRISAGHPLGSDWTTRRDRLLMLSPVMPSDTGNGLAMRAGFFLDAYSHRFDVDLVVAPIAGFAEPSNFVRSRACRIEILELARPDSHYALAMSVRDPIARIDALRHYGRPSLTAFIGPIRHALDRLAAENRYKAVHVFRLYMAELATPWLADGGDRSRMVIDCDENDISTYRRLAGMERRRRNPIAAALAKTEAEAFSRFAAQWLPKFDLLLAASRKEVISLSAFGVRTAVMPNVAFPARARGQRRRGACVSILFVGTLGYAPNADAVTWFISRIWPRLERALRHRVRLTIVGGNLPPEAARHASRRGIRMTGAVADIVRYYRDADFVIAPLRAGGGTRIKILEAAAHGCPVVATSFAVEGTTFQHEAGMLVADGEANFLRGCLLLARGGAFPARLATRARAKVRRDYSPAYWRERLADLVCGWDAG
jgi:glycosyltransferase involved in cell wall biosynthesis